MKLGEAILMYRVKNNLSMSAMAEKIGVSMQTVYNLETVGTNPSKTTRAKIKMLLGDEYKIDEEAEEDDS